MQIKGIPTDYKKVNSDILIVGIYEGSKDKRFSELLKDENFKGKKGELLLLNSDSKLKAKKIAFLGLGKEKELTRDIIRDGLASCARMAVKKEKSKLAVLIEAKNIEADILGQTIAEGIILGEYKFKGYHKKDEDKEKWKGIRDVVVIVKSSSEEKKVNVGAKVGKIVAEAENRARDLVNAPANIATPEFISAHAQKIAKEEKLKIQILDPQKEGMGLFWSVARGAKNKAKLVAIRYNGDPKNKKELIAIIGKGVTFDSGGISIKPSGKMYEMKMDMSGSAAVIEGMKAISQLKIKKNILVLAPLTENMPDGDASRPGDVATGLDGTTVEIISTDAEGRMILADAITYAKNVGATKIFDCATLTGGCVIALGDIASGLLGNDDDFIKEIEDAADKSGQKVWHLPIFEEYKDYLKSNVADLKNCTDRGMASASVGAVFLQRFVGETPWVHLDIAGTAYQDKVRGSYGDGGTGVPLRTIVEWLRS